MIDLCLEPTSLQEKVKIKSITLLVDKDTDVLDDEKETVVTAPFSYKQLLITEKFTTSDEVNKCTENITTSE